MATSGTVGQTVFTTRKLLEHAFGRCKVKRVKITAEMLGIGLDCAWLALSNLANRSVQLWAIENTILPLYQNNRLVPLPVGTLDVLTATLRNLTRLTEDATVASSAGGTASYAFDDDFDTACTQTSANGNLSAQWVDDVLVTTVGLLFESAFSGTLNFERSDDGSAWVTVSSVTSVTGAAGEWLWYDLNGSLATTYFRVRASAGGTLDVTELFLGNNPREITIARLNLDDWSNLPNKTAAGAPLQFYLDRARSQPIMNIYYAPSTEYRYNQVIVNRSRQLEDVGTLTQEVELPQRYYDAVVWDVAWRLAAEVEEVQVDYEKLQRSAEKALLEAEAGDTDDSPTYIAPDIGVYTSA